MTVLPFLIRIVDVKQAALCIIGMEGQPKQPLFSVAAANLARNIQKGSRKQFSTFEDE